MCDSALNLRVVAFADGPIGSTEAVAQEGRMGTASATSWAARFRMGACGWCSSDAGWLFRSRGHGSITRVQVSTLPWARCTMRRMRDAPWGSSLWMAKPPWMDAMLCQLPSVTMGHGSG